MSRQLPDDTVLRLLEEIRAILDENGRAADGLTARLDRIEEKLTNLNKMMAKALGARIEPAGSTRPPSGRSNRPH